MIINCAMCGTEIIIKSRQKYCADCRTIARLKSTKEYLQRKKLGKHRPLGSTDICKVCGKTYTVEGSLQMYCKKCVPEKYAETDRIQGLEYYNKFKDTINPPRMLKRRKVKTICIICGKEFPTKGNINTCSDKCNHERIKRNRKKTDYKRGQKKLLKGNKKMKLVQINGTRNIHGGIDNLDEEIRWTTDATTINDALDEYDYVIPNTEMLPAESYRDYAMRMFIINGENPGDNVSYLELRDHNGNVFEKMN